MGAGAWRLAGQALGLPGRILVLLANSTHRPPLVTDSAYAVPQRDQGNFDLEGALLLAMTTVLMLATITQLDRMSENVTLVTLFFAFKDSAVVIFVV